MVADEGEGPSRKRAREEEGTLASPPDADTTQFLPCTTPAPMLAEEGDAAPASAQPMGTQLPDEDDGAPPPRQQQPQPERAALLAAGEAGAPASPAAAPLSCGGSDSEDDRGNYVEEGDFSSDDGEGLQRELVAQLGRYMQARAMFEALAARRKRISFCVSVPVLSEKTKAIWPRSAFMLDERARAASPETGSNIATS